MNNLTKQVVMVTGGSSGLGRAIGVEAARRGATVIFAARREDALQESVAAVYAETGRDADYVVLDVADATAVDAAVADIMERHGRVDVLVNAAGFGHFEDALEIPLSTIEQMFKTNVIGLMYLTRLIGREMVTRRTGHIINIASFAGKMATPKSALYSATKFAVIGYSNALRLELKPFGVRVTTVNPGPIATDFFEVAEANDYLKSVSWIVLDPQKLAKTIVNAIGRSVREINRPRVMSLASTLYTLAPHVGDALAGGIFNRK